MLDRRAARLFHITNLLPIRSLRQDRLGVPDLITSALYPVFCEQYYKVVGIVREGIYYLIIRLPKILSETHP